MDPLLLVIIIVLVLWLAGFGFHIGGNLIHLLLVVLLVVVVLKVMGNRQV